LDLYDLSFLKVFFVFTMGRCGVVGEGKTERVERVTPGRPHLLQCLLQVGGILILLEITVGVVAVVLGALAVVEGL